jgi:cytoskeletal protein CcmA (bactofilin family)
LKFNEFFLIINGGFTMKKSILKTSMLSLAVIFCMASGIALAKSTTIETVKTDEVFPRDKFAAAQNFRNDGTIKGDMFFWAQSASSTGTVTGDIIGAGQDVSLSGTVQGNIRTVGSNVTISGNVAKNVITCGAVVMITDGSRIDGSLIACGQSIIVNGKVKGNARIFGEKITLQGEFFGDVTVNYLNIDKKDRDDMDMKDSLTVLPGTVVHGILTYGGRTADIQKGSRIADFKWIKPAADAKDEVISRETRKHTWTSVKLLLTTVVLFLIGLLMYKKFPAVFTGMGDFSVQKPWNAILNGLIAVFSTIPALVLFIVLMILAFIMSPAFGLIFGITAVTLFAALFYFSTIPVGLWLGNIILRKNPNVLVRFGLGLILFNLTVLILNLLGAMKVAGPLFTALAFIVKFGAVLLGTGILMHAVKELYAAAKKG